MTFTAGIPFKLILVLDEFEIFWQLESSVRCGNPQLKNLVTHYDIIFRVNNSNVSHLLTPS